MNDKKQICLNKSVLDFMESKLTSESTVLEFGSGWSSAWFAARCYQLVTVETDRKWFAIVERDLRLSGFTNWAMILANPSLVMYGATIDRNMSKFELRDNSVDLILIDCREDCRDAAVHLAWLFLKPGGWILFDDAQRTMHTGAISWLTEKAGRPEILAWSPGDVESAKPRLTLAWQKT